MDADSDDLLGAAQTAPPATLGPRTSPRLPTRGCRTPPIPFGSSRLRSGSSCSAGGAQHRAAPEEYLKFYRRPLTQALKMVDSQYTPESARGGKPSGRARKATLGAFLREHLADAVEVRQRPHGQHEIVAFGTPPTRPPPASTARCRVDSGPAVRWLAGAAARAGATARRPSCLAARRAMPTTSTPGGTATPPSTASARTSCCSSSNSRASRGSSTSCVTCCSASV